jgi:hypothetical protein
LSVTVLWQAIDGELTRTNPPAPSLAFDGRDQIAQELARLAVG